MRHKAFHPGMVHPIIIIKERISRLLAKLFHPFTYSTDFPRVTHQSPSFTSFDINSHEYINLKKKKEKKKIWLELLSVVHYIRRRPKIPISPSFLKPIKWDLLGKISPFYMENHKLLQAANPPGQFLDSYRSHPGSRKHIDLSDRIPEMDRALKNWSWRIEFTEDSSFLQKHQLEALPQLTTIKLCPGLLKAAAQCWDPTVHVFRMGEVQLCPTVEEFRACLLLTPKRKIFKPCLGKDYRHEIQEFFSWDKKAICRFVQDQRLQIKRMIKSYAHTSPTKKEEQVQRRHVYLYCSIARLLLRSCTESESPVIIDFIKHARQGFDIIPTVLAETLKGLDFMAIHQDPFDLDNFSGSPYLLQIWLTERLGLVEESEATTLNPFQLAKRADPMAYQMDTDWSSRLKEITAADIRWKCTWWKQEWVVTNTENSLHVRFMGLTHTSFYSPTRLPQQFNIPASTNREVTDCELPRKLTLELVDTIAREWNNRNVQKLPRVAPIKKPMVF